MEVCWNIGEVGEEDAVDAVRKWGTRDGQRWEKGHPTAKRTRLCQCNRFVRRGGRAKT